MKNILLAIIAIILVSCNAISYDKEYSKDGYFHSGSSIYFRTNEQADTIITYSFGTKWIDVESNIVKVPVQILGMTSNKDLRFSVRVNEELSTAKEGINFNLESKSITLKKDSSLAYIPVELIRKGLATDKEGDMELVLELIDSKDVKVAQGLANRIHIKYNDYLEKPMWWDLWLPYYKQGEFSRILYLKYLSFFDYDINKFNASLGDFTGFLLIRQKVKNYFDEHPEYGITVED